jgi:reactive chlorine resistance protein C
MHGVAPRGRGSAAAGSSVTRYGLVTTLVWVGALKFTDYEVQNAEVLVTASALTSRLRKKLGAQGLAWLVGVTQIALGSLIAAKPLGAALPTAAESMRAARTGNRS